MDVTSLDNLSKHLRDGWIWLFGSRLQLSLEIDREACHFPSRILGLNNEGHESSKPVLDLMAYRNFSLSVLALLYVGSCKPRPQFCLNASMKI